MPPKVIDRDNITLFNTDLKDLVMCRVLDMTALCICSETSSALSPSSTFYSVIIIIFMMMMTMIVNIPINSFLVPAPDTATWLPASIPAFGRLFALPVPIFRENILDVALVKVFLKLLCLEHCDVSSLDSETGGFDKSRRFMWMAGKGLSLNKKKKN